MKTATEPRDLRRDLSASRTFLMGVAMVWIVLCHVWPHFSLPEGRVISAVSTVLCEGYAGCDLFLFLSGFGLAFSLKKDASVSSYLQRRAEKLLPPYYPFVAVYALTMFLISDITLTEILGLLTFSGFWLGLHHQFNWYIQALPAFYMAAMVCFAFLERFGRSWKLWALVAVAVAALEVAFFGSYQGIAVVRLPVFLVGLWFGLGERELPWTWGKGVAVAAAFGAGIVIWNLVEPVRTWENGLYWYPFLLIVPAMSLALAGVRPVLLKCPLWRTLDRTVCLFGTCSLEIYLIHDLAVEWIFTDVTGNLFWLILAAVPCLLGIAYHFLVKAAIKKWRATYG